MVGIVIVNFKIEISHLVALPTDRIGEILRKILSTGTAYCPNE
jgi:hypothetical protein